MDDSNDNNPSKSQKKRDAAALQALGKQLIALDDAVLDTLPLTEGLRQALQDATRIKSHGATRRQMQLIGKLMRSADHDAIGTAIAALQADDAAQTAEFHVAELWRDNLLEGGAEALSTFIDTFHPDDIQYLRQLIKKAGNASVEIQQKTARRKLFRYIRLYV